ncbi:DUF2634 domain-containing protein [Caproicibacter sp.]|uniref:DUF2634 domain-containing protein n=1 Tax=Caproicibacter sp. TaxID=2814884 RepID=UPI003989A4E5
MANLGDTDIRLDDSWQLTRAANGDAPVASGLDCLMQDIRLEAMTQEGELFYDADWGWSLLDFAQSDGNELVELEIQQRIRTKLSRHSEIDVETIATSVSFSADIIRIHTTFQFVNDSRTQTVDTGIDRVNVEVVNSD